MRWGAAGLLLLGKPAPSGTGSHQVGSYLARAPELTLRLTLWGPVRLKDAQEALGIFALTSTEKSFLAAQTKILLSSTLLCTLV